MKKSLVIGGIAGLLGLCLCGGVVAGGAALVSGVDDTAADAVALADEIVERAKRL